MRNVFGSVRARAALGATLVVAVALVAAGVAVLRVLSGNLVGQAGLQAEVAAREVAAQIATGTPVDRLDLPDADERPVVVRGDDDGGAGEDGGVGGDGGAVLAVSDELAAVDGRRVTAVADPGREHARGDDDDDADADAADDDDDEPRPRPGRVGGDVEVRDGTAVVDGADGEYRFAAVKATGADGRTVTVLAGGALAPERAAVGSARSAMLAGLPGLLVVVAGVTWLVTRRALRPVEGIRREMAAITASTDLARRVPEPAARDEIARLARTTNETLAALETSVERQRRFVADASHELRSPIASLRTQLEVAEAHPELLDLPGAVEDTVRLQRLAADLLLLARLDAGERPAEGRVDLAAMVREELSQRVGDRVAVGQALGEGADVIGSRGQLGRVLGNLVDNAQRHARSEVGVSVLREARWVVLRVEDDGPGVPEEERERIFERFVRLDDARTRDDGGAGLGLAIARDVAERHGGSLRVVDGAVFELRLPPAER